MNFILRIISVYIATLARIAPALAVRQAFQIFQRPVAKKLRPKERAFYQQHPAQCIDTPEGKVHYYKTGAANGPLVVLVHGWASNAASLSGIGAMLSEQGFCVVSVDMPGHGQSKEKRANLLTMSRHLQAVLDVLSPQSPFSVVAHSFGSMVTAYTLSKQSYAINRG